MIKLRFVGLDSTAVPLVPCKERQNLFVGHCSHCCRLLGAHGHGKPRPLHSSCRNTGLSVKTPSAGGLSGHFTAKLTLQDVGLDTTPRQGADKAETASSTCSRVDMPSDKAMKLSK